MDETPPLGQVRDDEWFAALYTAHHGRVLAYARRRTKEFDDVVADVFATAWRHRVRVPDDPVPWLLRTASHQVLLALRAGGRRQRLADRAFGQGPVVVQDHADQVAGRHDASEIVTAALSRLSAADQEVLRLAAWEDLTPAEIAYVLGSSDVTARVRLHRAKRRLAQHLNIHPTFDGPEIGRLATTTCEVQP